MKKIQIVFGLGGFAFASALFAQDVPTSPVPDLSSILEKARNSYVSRDHDYKGSLRQGRTRTPFQLSTQEGQLWFRFSEPSQVIHLKRDKEVLVMREVVEGSDAPVAKSRYAEFVRDTDLSYEDLSMRFLYWSNPQYLGEEKIQTARCWKVKMSNPEKAGAYRGVVLWVDQGSGGIAQMIGLDEQGRVLRRLLVMQAQKIAGSWMLKRMRIERIDPENGKVLSRTYLEIDDPDSGKKPANSFRKR